MHKGARTDLCGGRGVTRVPTATLRPRRRRRTDVANGSNCARKLWPRVLLNNIASRRTGVNYPTHAIRSFRYDCCRVSNSYWHPSIREWWCLGSCPARNREAVLDSFGYRGDGVVQLFRPAVVAIRFVEGIDKHQQRFFEHANHSCKMAKWREWSWHLIKGKQHPAPKQVRFP
jgi:hypothetical protein